MPFSFWPMQVPGQCNQPNVWWENFITGPLPKDDGMRGESKAKRGYPENAKVTDLENFLLLLQLFRNLAVSFLRTENAEHVQMPRYRIEAMTLEKLKEPELSVCPWQTIWEGVGEGTDVITFSWGPEIERDPCPRPDLLILIPLWSE